MEKKSYIVVGDNNYWYATTGLMTKKQGLEVLKRVKKEIKKHIYEDNGAEYIHLYEAKEVISLEI